MIRDCQTPESNQRAISVVITENGTNKNQPRRMEFREYTSCLIGALVFLGLLTQAFSWPVNEDLVKRIVGGVESEANHWPWQGMLLILRNDGSKTYIQKCGAVLIHPQWVITTAACVFSVNPKDLKVVLGEHVRDKVESTEQEFDVTLVHLHRRFFTDKGYGYNIALLKLSSPAIMTTAVHTVDLPRNGRIPVGTMCYMVGWGSTEPKGEKSNVLRQVRLPVVSYEDCKRNDKLYSKIDDESMLCAGYGDGKTLASGCDGDAGGSFACKSHSGSWELRGVVSWGDANCGAYYYTVMTRISSFVGWIDEMMKTPALEKPTSCTDDHFYCEEWKAKGYCNIKYFERMLKGYYCKKTCGAC